MYKSRISIVGTKLTLQSKPFKSLYEKFPCKDFFIRKNRCKLLDTIDDQCTINYRAFKLRFQAKAHQLQNGSLYGKAQYQPLPLTWISFKTVLVSFLKKGRLLKQSLTFKEAEGICVMERSAFWATAGFGSSTEAIRCATQQLRLVWITLFELTGEAFASWQSTLVRSTETKHPLAELTGLTGPFMKVCDSDLWPTGRETFFPAFVGELWVDHCPEHLLATGQRDAVHYQRDDELGQLERQSHHSASGKEMRLLEIPFLIIAKVGQPKWKYLRAICTQRRPQLRYKEVLLGPNQVTTVLAASI